MTATYDSGVMRSGEPLFDPDGFLNPAVLERFCIYMAAHRTMPDGQVRASDNWQSGPSHGRPKRALKRHVLDVWLLERGYSGRESDNLEDALCAVMFNAMAELWELLQERGE